jgi:hypothetical protein
MQLSGLAYARTVIQEAARRMMRGALEGTDEVASRKAYNYLHSNIVVSLKLAVELKAAVAGTTPPPC